MIDVTTCHYVQLVIKTPILPSAVPQIKYQVSEKTHMRMLHINCKENHTDCVQLTVMNRREDKKY